VKCVSECYRFKAFKITYAIVVLAGSASRLGVELARAASGHLVGDSLDVVVGGRHCCLWLNLKFRKVLLVQGLKGDENNVMIMI